MIKDMDLEADQSRSRRGRKYEEYDDYDDYDDFDEEEYEEPVYDREEEPVIPEHESPAQMRRRLQKEAEEKKAAENKAKRIYRNRETGESYTVDPAAVRRARAERSAAENERARDESRRRSREDREERIREPERYEREEEGGKKKSSALIWVLLVVFLLVFLFSLYQLISIYLEYRKGENDYDNIRQEAQQMLEEARKSNGKKTSSEGETEAVVGETTQAPTDSAGNEVKTLPNRERNQEWFKQLEFAYQGIVGWITIEDTVVDYPVMYSGDNEYYLTHTSVGTINSSGSIFLEQTNHTDMNDYHTLIYGHNMKNGSMFATLRKYEYDYDFWQNHRYITLESPEGTLTYEIFSVQITDAYSDVYTVGFWPGEVFADYVQRLKNASMYDTGVTVTDQDYILTLSTCTNSTGDGRTVVHAKRIETPAE